MPNWCNNVLTLNEDTDDSIWEVLKDYLTDGRLDFELIRPLPDELRGTTSPTPNDTDPKISEALIQKYGADNWWDWCVQNWGTKWNSDMDAESIQDKHSMVMSTAWSPPIPIVAQLSKLTGRDFRLTYIEEGIDFCGEYFSYKNWLENVDCEFSPITKAPKKLKEELCGDSWWEGQEEDEDEEE